ncbi:Tfp pilus assembly protein PilE [Flavobacterium sp. W4I14]|nr:Tfp pilus assembly protein PilE [Flavobacterium sp. W4I14]
MRGFRINAYTLMEVTLAMLLSAISITVCYTAYGLVANYYKTFARRNESADVVLSLRHVLEKDFLNGKYVLHGEEGIEIVSDSSKIGYKFRGGCITREINLLHVDTFKVAPSHFVSFFEGREAVKADTLDEIRFVIQLDSTVSVPLGFHKKYSAHDLFR